LKPVRVTVVVVSYNSAADLPACLDSILAQRGVEPDIWVVDNASSDDSVEVVRRRFPEAHLIVNPRNEGFARANNLVLSRLAASDSTGHDEPGTATPGHVALVNPDAVLSADALATAVSFLDAHPDVGVVATRLVYPDGRLHRSCHSFLNLTNLIGETTGLEYVLPHTSLGSLHMRGFAHDRVRDVDWIQGAFLVLPVAICRKVGVFDPDFFMYGEEMDWCARIRRAGDRIVFLPEPPVTHVGGSSSRPVAGPMFVEQLRSRVRFFAKYHRGARVRAARFVIGAGALLRLLGWELVARFRATDDVRLRVRMFRAAARWVVSGMPMPAPASSASVERS
jgi:GT2 family glycosyltransferase